MSFLLFKSKLEKYYVENNIIKALPTDDFLFWLIGFSEGDGSFVINKRNELSFILIQGAANKILLDNILENLKLGHIIKQNTRVYRLIVQKKVEIELIVELFNGNIILPTRKIQFEKFYKAFISKNKNLTNNYIKENNSPSFDNTWLLGFVEAEGCFTVSLLSNSNAYRTRFIISQKGDINLPILSKFILIFNTGFLEGHHNKDNYNFIISGLNNISNIYPYFDKYINYFQGIKKNSYLNFKYLNNMFKEKKHLDILIRKRMDNLAKEVNSAYRKFK